MTLPTFEQTKMTTTSNTNPYRINYSNDIDSKRTLKGSQNSKTTLTVKPNKYQLLRNYDMEPIYDNKDGSDVNYDNFVFGKDFFQDFCIPCMPRQCRRNRLFYSKKHPYHIAKFKIIPKKSIIDPLALKKSQEIIIIKSTDYELEDVIDRLYCFPNTCVNKTTFYNHAIRKKVNLSNQKYPEEKINPPNFMFLNPKPLNFDFSDLIDFISDHRDKINWETKHVFCVSPNLDSPFLKKVNGDPFMVKYDPEMKFLLRFEEIQGDHKTTCETVPIGDQALRETKTIDDWNFYVGHHGDLEDNQFF